MNHNGWLLWLNMEAFWPDGLSLSGLAQLWLRHSRGLMSCHSWMVGLSPKAVHRMIYPYFMNTETTNLKLISFCMLRWLFQSFWHSISPIIILSNHEAVLEWQGDRHRNLNQKTELRGKDLAKNEHANTLPIRCKSRWNYERDIISKASKWLASVLKKRWWCMHQWNHCGPFTLGWRLNYLLQYWTRNPETTACGKRIEQVTEYSMSSGWLSMVPYVIRMR